MNNEARMDRARLGWALTGLLTLAVYLEAARLIERHVRVQVDVSEDQLQTPSPATARLLERLDDVAQLELFFTESSESAPFQLARRRVDEELRALSNLARGRLRFVRTDPSRSSTAELEAKEYGVVPLDLSAVAGSRLSIERTWLGGVLRYRGAEQVIPTFYPGGVEYQ
ncbi:MAG: Gldg family protein, partial [Planctomycetota bacterium]